MSQLGSTDRKPDTQTLLPLFNSWTWTYGVITNYSIRGHWLQRLDTNPIQIEVSHEVLLIQVLKRPTHGEML